MLLLQNGRVIDPKSGLDQVMDLVTGNGKILELGNDLKEKYPDARVIDALMFTCTSVIRDLPIRKIFIPVLLPLPQADSPPWSAWPTPNHRLITWKPSNMCWQKAKRLRSMS